MSADNFIAVQKRQGLWYVWMESASAYTEGQKLEPHGVDRRSFGKKSSAYKYAEKLRDGEIVEYGVIELPKVK